MKRPRVGVKGEAHGLQRPVQSITNSSLRFCSESFHIAGHVKVLSRSPNRRYILAITTALQFQPSKVTVVTSVPQRCAWCKKLALRSLLIVFSQELHYRSMENACEESAEYFHFLSDCFRAHQRNQYVNIYDNQTEEIFVQ